MKTIILLNFIFLSLVAAMAQKNACLRSVFLNYDNDSLVPFSSDIQELDNYISDNIPDSTFSSTVIISYIQKGSRNETEIGIKRAYQIVTHLKMQFPVLEEKYFVIIESPQKTGKDPEEKRLGLVVTIREVKLNDVILNGH